MLRDLIEKGTTQAAIALALTLGVLVLGFRGIVEPADIVKGWLLALAFFFAVSASANS